MRRISGTWEPAITMLTEKPQVETPRGREYGCVMAGTGQRVLAMKASHKRMASRCVEEPDFDEPTSNGRSPMNEAKPFCIAKKEVWEAYQRVKSNKGSAGIDGQTIEDFEKRLKKSLYRIWNRCRRAATSLHLASQDSEDTEEEWRRKKSMGIPTVADRIAQQVVKARLEPEVDPHFHPDSYGYRPAKSALDAVGQARRRCWRNDWVLDLDIKAFFDNRIKIYCER